MFSVIGLSNQDNGRLDIVAVVASVALVALV